jgi:acetyl-CoA carboxylase carboxyltransferase component
MLDSTVDLRTPRFLVIIRNAFGGAYASYNNYATGADLVVALPTTRAAVMGTAGMEFVYKDELKEIRSSVEDRIAEASQKLVQQGMAENQAISEATDAVNQWVKEQEAILVKRYEEELMNPNEALSLGSISQIVMPSEMRKLLAENVEFHLRHYKPEPLSGVQREFH